MMRKMDARDVGDVIDLTDQEKWRYGREDILRMLRLDPEGCIVVEEDILQGCVFAVSLGSKGVIGGLIVDKDHRGLGIGKALMKASIEHLKSCGHIELFSYEHTAEFYERFGFKRSEKVLRMVGNVDGTSECREKEARPISEDDIGWLQTLDNPVFGGNRLLLLRDMMREKCPSICFPKKAYGFAKGTPEDCFDIGPVVCSDGSIWRELLKKLPESCVEVSIPENRADALEEARKSGFHKSFTNIRMTLGRHEPIHPGIWAIGGLEKG